MNKIETTLEHIGEIIFVTPPYRDYDKDVREIKSLLTDIGYTPKDLQKHFKNELKRSVLDGEQLEECLDEVRFWVSRLKMA